MTLRVPHGLAPGLALALPLSLAIHAGCSSNASSASSASSAASGSGGGAGGACGTASTGAGAGPIAGFGTIFTVVFENHDYAEIVGSANAPFFNELIAKYGLATNYYDAKIHPSLPNYLTMISGAPQYPGGLDYGPTVSGFPKDQPNLGGQMEAAGIAWRSYQESMPAPCTLDNAGHYAPKHDPFLYFTNIQLGACDVCKRRNVPDAELAADLAAGKHKYMWFTPNLISDGHDPDDDPIGALKASDAWAKDFIAKLMASDAYKTNGVIFITWDEAEGRNGDDKDKIPMIVVSPKIVSAGFQSAKPYSHKSYLATVEDLLGLPRLDTVKNEATLMEFFAK